MNEELKATIKEITTCKHGKNRYSLSINVGDTHVTISSHCYDHSPGNSSCLDIFHITPQDMYELADKIIKAANKISNEDI
jgi:hypothetical protein